MTQTQYLNKFFDTVRCGFSPFHETSDTGSNGNINSTVYRKDPIFKEGKIRDRLHSDHFNQNDYQNTNSIKGESLKGVVQSLGGRVGVSAGGFPTAFAIAELGASVGITNRAYRGTRYCYYSYEVQKKRWSLPPLSDLQEDYVQNNLFRDLHITSVEEAMGFMDTKGYYYIDDMILGGRVSYSCRVEEINNDRGIEMQTDLPSLNRLPSTGLLRKMSKTA